MKPTQGMILRERYPRKAAKTTSMEHYCKLIRGICEETNNSAGNHAP